MCLVSGMLQTQRPVSTEAGWLVWHCLLVVALTQGTSCLDTARCTLQVRETAEFSALTGVLASFHLVKSACKKQKKQRGGVPGRGG